MSGPIDPSDRVEWRDLPPRPCPVAGSLDLFGDRWSILIIRDVMNGVGRFDDLVRFGEGRRDRFFEEDVAAGGEGP